MVQDRGRCEVISDGRDYAAIVPAIRAAVA